jgi:hypothetical protein
MKRFDPLQSLGLRKREKRSDLPETSGENLYSPKKDKRQQSSIRRTLKEITVSQFIECYCNNNLSVLVIEGIPDVSELQQVWQDILLDYSSATRSEASQLLFEISKKIALLQSDINDITLFTDFLRIKYDPEIAQLLQQRSLVKLTVGFDDEAAYIKQLDHAVSVSKRKQHDLDELKADYDRVRKVNEGKEIAEDDFNELVALIGKFMGFSINKRQTYMDEFVGMYNLFIKQNKN